MKSYMVMVECEDYITVDAESESDAEHMAKDIFRCNPPESKATVLHVDDAEEQADGIPY